MKYRSRLKNNHKDTKRTKQHKEQQSDETV